MRIMLKKKYIVGLLVAFVYLVNGCSVIVAQENIERRFDVSFILHFKINKSKVDTDLPENSLQLDNLKEYIEKIQADSLLELDSVLIVSSASPDGNKAYNYALSVLRAENTAELLKGEYIGGYENVVVQIPVGENWEALKKIVTEDLMIPDREKLLQIIDADMDIDKKEKEMRKYRDAFRYILKHHIDGLRTSVIVLKMKYRDKYFAALVPYALSVEALPEPERIAAYLPPSGKKSRKFVLPPIAVKTNLLYDMAITPNIGVEYFFKERWSVGLNWMYAWWKSDRKHFFWRVYGGDVEARYWLGKDGFGRDRKGHHLGAYLQTATFDFELGGNGQMVDKISFGGGLSYGYSLPVTRNLNLDFSLGLGYFRGYFKEYTPMDGHYVWKKTRLRNWIGPTKAEVSLVWHIGKK